MISQTDREVDDKVVRAIEIIDRSSNITVLTGAGISAESGIPTFRGEGGLWRNFRSEDLATREAFLRDPKLVWEWYEWRRGIVKGARPNRGHYAIVQLEKRKSRFTLITQNIDGLHQVAGSRKIIEMHGNIWQIRCTRCGLVYENRDVPLNELPPRCKSCGTIGRPNVVWFGEMIPMQIIDRALIAIEECDVMLIVGTSGVVEPAASMGLLAKQTGKTVIELNVEPTFNSRFYDLTILGKSGEVLPLLCKSAEP
ncbi:MAG TPA: NAD-dependent deacylase [Thermodesulfobacteriota bacterium]|nr:NAD-dependent deacylase [Thermodesulfobacteriota bacterium]